MADADDETLQNGKLGDKKGKKKSRFYPTEDVKKPVKNKKPRKPIKLRASITPGTILILLDEIDQGKKAIFLKQLTSGLLLVTGPSKLSQVPLKRVKQQYVIATKTKIDIGDFQLPEGLTDELFKRKAKKRKRSEDMFTEETQEDENPSQEFVEKQEAVDEHILAKIAEVEHLELYMETPFSLKKGQYPHAMIF
ncbi:60S ribosomal protein L6 [Acropora cervicornis]|uniref:Large ribosomal subunit protein eL6 n=1 Tax=Acropora cervicornis TaxID=6130 RepID=A0AAD9V1Y4_ACRCE|nr:60S ribosomal protein L6 [Acropora cervicornis]